MKFFYLTALLFFSLAQASTPDYEAIITEVQDEAEARAETATEAVPAPALIYGEDLTTGDIREGQQTGQFSTLRSRQEGEPALQERLRADLLQWTAAKREEVEAFRQDMTKATDLAYRHVDGDDSNDDLDVLSQLETADENQHGPRARTADVDKGGFADSSSNTLNPAPHAASQIGDPCMSAEGNSSSLMIDPIAPTYGTACEGDSLAENLDCTLGATKEINSESQGGSANSSQTMQAPNTRSTDRLQNVDTASTSDYTTPSCPTTTRLAEGVTPNVADLIASDRQAFEQVDLVGGRSSGAIVYQPPVNKIAEVVQPWYQKALAFIFPKQARASTPTVGTLRGQTYTTGRENELQKQDFAKYLSDLNSYPDMYAEQLWANTMAKTLEEENQVLRSEEQLTTQIQENFAELANKPQVPY